VRESGARLPAVIFVTAYDQHALQAFEVHAVDFVLKPYGRERLRAALKRAREQIAGNELFELTNQVHSLLDEVRLARKEYAERFAVREAGRVLFVMANELVWVEAHANRLLLHTAKSSHPLASTLQWIESRLDPRRFVRVNRSALVNVRYIRELQPWFHGEYKVLLADGTTLSLTRRYRDCLPSLLGDLPPTE
jgi:two-component system, LytTR family, response regulator